jgi:uncharacterized protein YxjI
MNKLITLTITLLLSLSAFSTGTTIPNKFNIKQDVFTLAGSDFTIVANGKTHGRIVQRVFNWGNTFEYFDITGKKVATAKEEVFTWGVKINITDATGKRIGRIEEKVFSGWFDTENTYHIYNESNQLVGKSHKNDWFATDIYIDINSKRVVSLERDFFNMFSDTWRVNINTTSTIDKRLLVFIPCYKTVADDARSSKSSSNSSSK